MSKDDDRPPIKPEIVGDAEPQQPGRLQRIERNSPPTVVPRRGLLSILPGPVAEARKARRWADAVNAHTELNNAQVGLRRAQETLGDIDTILAADDTARDLTLLRATNELEEEKRIAEGKALRDELDRETLLAKIAEARQRRQKAERGAAGDDDETARIEREVERQFREGMGQQITEQAIRRRGQELTDQIMKRARGVVTDSVQRELDNVRDTMDRLLNKI